MSSANVLVATDARGVATLTLSRPAVRNAFDEALIHDLTEALQRIGADDEVRVLVVTGAGSAFSAGGDLNWMKRMAGYGEAENYADAMRLATMLRTLNELPKPTVARVNGAAFAGGVGLICCCDTAVAATSAVFSVSEVRLGLVPATIGPYVVAAIGVRAARRYNLTGETFAPAEALRIGLVDEVAPDAELDAAVERLVAALLAGGPRAQGRAKRLIAEVADRPIDNTMMALTARTIAEARASAEGREGVLSFLEKRRPAWRK
ncbi:MAG TPA: enoyl-CoA hydratase/isomerase family protein [Stellaceae bacterium]|nr:enoyl-CoA hydratase/isomerase family protein [Stellaceae bacterium]